MTKKEAARLAGKARAQKTDMTALGRKGGEATVKKYGTEYMAEIGRKGATAFYEKYTLMPVGINNFAIVRKLDGVIVGTWYKKER
jgi:general stress protein YciG